MDKFKSGDTVRRVARWHLGMRVGDEGTVVSYVPAGTGSRADNMTDGVVLAEWPGRETAGTHSVGALELVARAVDQHARKDDSGKLDMNLLDDMPRALKAVVEVMQWAIVCKQPVPYERGSWLGIEPDRYRAAIKRHERSAAEQATAEVPARLQCDAETGLLHLAHTACSALMALENVLREAELKVKDD